jgi:hypothetical protein
MTETESPVILYPKRTSAVWLFLCSAAFVAGGILLLDTRPLIGFVSIAFFGLGLPLAVAQVLPGSTYLEIDHSGFTFCSLYRRTTVPWSVINEFRVVTLRHMGMKTHQMVGFNFVDSYDKHPVGRRISRMMGGCESALPDTYGKKAEVLASLMNNCLERSREQETANQPSHRTADSRADAAISGRWTATLEAG